MKYCLIGKTLSHSYSRTLHRSYGLDYDLVEVAEADLPLWLRRDDHDGFNVTIPYKEAVIPYLDGLDPSARRCGAVNTVRRKGDKLWGYNTDYEGLVGAYAHYGVQVKGRNVLILGTGGAAKMAAVAMRDLGAASVQTVSRRGPVDYTNCYEQADTHILINATPVGTYPNVDASPVDVRRWPRLQFVYDLVYNPYRTALVDAAKACGVPAQNGLAMLVIQALAARRIWEGTPYTPADIEACMGRLRSATLNIALVGMPSSGKSTVGRALAEATGKPYLDTDLWLTERHGRTPRQIITEDGEDAFRTLEEEAVSAVSRARGAILATGGGAVLRENNRSLLHHTAMVVYLVRELSLLSDEGRPTLQQAGAATMFARRDPIYRAMADVVVDNDGTVQSAVQRILQAYEHFGN